VIGSARRRAVCLLIGALISGVACGPSEGRRALSSNALGGGDTKSPVNLIESPGHPTIATLVRDGDPVAVVSLVLHAQGDTVALVALAEIATQRLRDGGVVADSRVDRDALFLDVALGAEPKATLVALRRAVETPFAATPALAARVAERIADIPVESGPAVSAVKSCAGALGVAKPSSLDPGSAAGATRIEKLRSTALSSENVAFGVVGPERSVSAAVDVLVGSDSWPTAPATANDAWQPLSSGVSVAPDLPSGMVRFSVAVQANDPAAAIAAAARLGRSPSSLGAHAERGGFRLTRVNGVARPRGACVSAVFEGKVPSTGDDEGREIADAAVQLSRAAAREVRAELAAGAGPLEAARRIAGSVDPHDAARLAAWWALSRPLEGAAPEGGGMATALELASDEPEVLRAKIEKSLGVLLLENARALPEAPKVRGRLERGQAETWVLVANPCAAASEAPHRWGAAAFAALSASQKAQAAARAIDPSITVEPFVSARGVGFLARAPRREGKDPARLAHDLATAATAAFFVAPPSADDLLSAEGVALERLRQSFGPAAPGLAELGAKMGEHPSALEPLGLPLRLARFDPLDLGRRLRATVDGPLVVTLLAENDVEKEGRAAAEAVARFTGPASSPICPPIPAPTAGRSEVREPRKGPSRVYWLFRAEGAPKARALSRALVSLVVGQPGPGVRAQVIEGRDHISVLVDVTSPDDDLARAEKTTADLLQKLAAGGFDDAALSRAISDEVSADQKALVDPRERLARLFTGDSADPHAPLEVAELREWIKRTVRVERAAVVVSRPE